MATLLPFLLLLLQIIAAMSQPNVLHSHCQEFCGNYSIPYPFGIGPGCYRDKTFELRCRTMNDGTMIPFIGGVNSTLRVFNFSVSQSQATMFKRLTYVCYNSSMLIDDRQQSGLSLEGTPFTISAKRNKFTAVGCNTMAYIEASGSYRSGCMAFCNMRTRNNTMNSSCTGTGCCQTSLPEDLVRYESGFYKRSINDTTWEFNPCSYSFVADENWFKFNPGYLDEDNFKLEFKGGVPLALDWVVGNVTCDEAKKNSSSYACRSSNSECYTHGSISDIKGYT